MPPSQALLRVLASPKQPLQPICTLPCSSIEIQRGAPLLRNLPTPEACSLCSPGWMPCHLRVTSGNPTPTPGQSRSKGHLLGPQDVGLQYGPRGRSLARECGSLLPSPWRFCPLLSIYSLLTGLPGTWAIPPNSCFQGDLLQGPLCFTPLSCPAGKPFPGQDLLLPCHISLPCGHAGLCSSQSAC